jgi:predicted deacylase
MAETSSNFGTIAQCPVEIDPPDLSRWLKNSEQVPGFITFLSNRPGPHVAILALVHGNEIAGAIALDRLLHAELRPVCGRLTFGFVNLAAFARFDPRQPTASRFVDEDMNRLWDAAILDGPRRSSELSRARAIRKLIETVDVLLDLHSMLWLSGPLTLCAPTRESCDFALALGVPDLVVIDPGHASGRRLIDYARFQAGHAVAALVEAGQHWRAETVETMLASIAGCLARTGVVPAHPALPAPQQARPRLARVSMTVTAEQAGFSFAEPFVGNTVLARAGTLIARDGAREIRTPHDDCLLVMPNLRPLAGHTAVRLARFLPENAPLSLTPDTGRPHA